MATVESLEGVFSRPISLSPEDRKKIDAGDPVYVGTFAENAGMYIGNFSVQVRNVCDPERPKLFGWRSHLTFGVQLRDNGSDGSIIPMVYWEDYQVLGDDIIAKAADYVGVLERRERI